MTAMLRFTSILEKLYAPYADGEWVPEAWNPRANVGLLAPADLVTHVNTQLEGFGDLFDPIRVIVMCHGFRYNPKESPALKPWQTTNPHGRIWHGRDDIDLAWEQEHQCPSWPMALGYRRDNPGHTLFLAYAWDSAPSWWQTWFRYYISAYERANIAAKLLSAVMDSIKAFRPNTTFDFISHSLGSRVVNRVCTAYAQSRDATKDPLNRIERVIFMGAAEYVERIKNLHYMLPKTQFFNMTCREDTILDNLAELFGPVHGPVLGQNGRQLPTDGEAIRPENWIDIQLDLPDLQAWGKQHDLDLSGNEPRTPWDHAGYFVHRGNMEFYRRILFEKPFYGIVNLRDRGIVEMPFYKGD